MPRNFRDFSVTQRLLALTAVALVPGAISLAFLVSSWHDAQEREIHGQALRHGQLAALEMERIVSGAEGVLKAIARAPAVRALAPEPCRDYLASVVPELPQFASIGALDRTGLLRCRNVMPESAVQLGERPYFKEALATGGFVVGEYTKSAVTGAGILPLAYPIRADDGTIAGVVVAALDLGWLGARLRDRDLAQGGALTIADRQGVIIARAPLPERFVGTRIPDGFQHLVRGEHAGTLEVKSQDGTQRVIGYYPPPVTKIGLYVSAGLSTEASVRQVFFSTYRSVAIGVLGAIVAFGLAWVAGRALFQRPIDRLLATVEAWRRGDHAARTGLRGGRDELATLAAAIDKFMDELAADRAARRQAEEHRDLVTRELDHRIKNILATVQAIASQTFGDTNRESLRAFEGRLAAMSNVHDMLMSRAWASADLRTLVDSALTPFHDSERKRFLVHGPELIVQARAAIALSMALHELCTNAAKYGALRAPAGRVEVAWAVNAAGDRFCLTWTERGGPPVVAPARSGFGSKMIEKVLALELAAKVSVQFPAAGVICTVECTPRSLLADGYDPDDDREAA